MQTALISFYSKINFIKSKETIPLDIFFDNIRKGVWQDIVLPIRAIEGKKERDALKVATAPSVTISGLFDIREDAKIKKHSGYLQIDVDEDGLPPGLTVEETKSIVCPDRYIVAAFQSISGRGLCLVFKINADKHRLAFAGLGEYLFTHYKITIDPTSVNPSRARFVSFDPGIYLADAYEKFVKYPKEKPPKKIEKIIFAKDDFEEIIAQIQNRRLAICDTYDKWLRVSFALVHKFGADGLYYFRIISELSPNYKDARDVDRQYANSLKHKSSHIEVTISTLYYYCKQLGVELYSAKTRAIAHTAYNGKKSGLSKKSVASNLDKFEGIETTPEVLEIIEQVMDNNIQLHDDTIIDQLELFIRQNYSLRRNEITRYIENNGKPLLQKDINTIYIKCKKIFEKLTSELLDKLVNSDFTPTYNPFIEFFEQAINEVGSEAYTDLRRPATCDLADINTALKHIKDNCPLIVQVITSIKTDTNDEDYSIYFLSKWFVGIISSIYGSHSPLMPVLAGEEQNTGKTEWFRRLLPYELYDYTNKRSYPNYYAESKLDAGKDDEILMCQKLIVVDDEMGGKSKKESKRLKELTSKQVFSLREPYGRNNVDLMRIANLGGNSNDLGILNDPTGNRRIVTLNVISIDHDKYNSVDKKRLFVEVYFLYMSGFRHKLNKIDIKYLGVNSEVFEIANLEAELIQQYFHVPKAGFEEYLTASQIKVILEDFSRQKLILDKIGKELTRLGFSQKQQKCNGKGRRVYAMQRVDLSQPLRSEEPKQAPEWENGIDPRNLPF